MAGRPISSGRMLQAGSRRDLGGMQMPREHPTPVDDTRSGRLTLYHIARVRCRLFQTDFVPNAWHAAQPIFMDATRRRHTRRSGAFAAQVNLNVNGLFNLSELVHPR